MDKEIKGFKTERGSVYTHLPDLRIQRFKTIEKKVDEPSDSIVFIPNYNAIKENYSRKPEIIEYVNKNMGYSEGEFKDFLNNAIYKGKSFGINNVYICNEKYDILRNNEDINDSRELYLSFLKKQGNSLFLPVDKNPIIGYYPFERSHFSSSQEDMKNVHLGNKVVDIARE